MKPLITSTVRTFSEGPTSVVGFGTEDITSVPVYVKYF